MSVSVLNRLEGPPSADRSDRWRGRPAGFQGIRLCRKRPDLHGLHQVAHDEGEGQA